MNFSKNIDSTINGSINYDIDANVTEVSKVISLVIEIILSAVLSIVPYSKDMNIDSSYCLFGMKKTTINGVYLGARISQPEKTPIS